MLKNRLIKLLNNDKRLEFHIDALIRGQSGVNHKVDIYISSPCNLAVVMPCGDLKVEILKAIIVKIDLQIPMIMLIDEKNLSKCKKEIFKALETAPIITITYSNPREDSLKIYQKIIEECIN